jgi:alkanesulfonate monooxygenase SsuD/methylene tetrahydromethanopterin reductase-like flavin-dependent oxidoreductase (luciferase family)
MAQWRAALAGSGKALEALVTLPTYVAETDAEARRDLAEPLMWLKATWVGMMPPPASEAQRQVQTRIAGLNFEETFATCFAGSVESVRARFRWLREHAGVEHALCSMHFGALPPERVLRSMELMARKVMPEFR